MDAVRGDLAMTVVTAGRGAADDGGVAAAGLTRLPACRRTAAGQFRATRGIGANRSAVVTGLGIGTRLAIELWSETRRFRGRGQGGNLAFASEPGHRSC